MARDREDFPSISFDTVLMDCRQSFFHIRFGSHCTPRLNQHKISLRPPVPLDLMPFVKGVHSLCVDG